MLTTSLAGAPQMLNSQSLTALVFTLALTLLPQLSIAETPRNQAELAVYEYPPLYHTSTEGQFSGTLGETIKQLCLKGGIECNTQMYPIARAYEMVISGQVDISISATHPRFNECCIATDWSYPWSAGLFSLGDTDIPKNENDMIGRSLIIVRGWRSQYRFIPNFDQLVAEGKLRVHYTNSNYSAIQMLSKGRAELLWGSVDFLWYLDKLGLRDQIQYYERLQIPIVLWVNKSAPQVLSALNQGFEVLKDNQDLDQHNLLRPELMQQLYQDAPMKKTQ